MNLSALIASAILLLSFTFGLGFRTAQNRNTRTGKWVGGEISWPKSFWLGYAVFNWFLMPAAFLVDTSLAPPLRALLLIHLGSWWVRGILELVMIYRWFNWSPVYGISHDLFHNLVLVGGLVWAAGTIGQEWNAGINLWAVLYCVTTVFAIMAEILFAALFLTTREKGAHKIYFASDSPEYRMINRFTLSVCCVVYLHLVLGVAGLWLR